LDLSKKLKEEFRNKLLERPLDLSQKNVTTDVREDTKPFQLSGQTAQYLIPTCCSSILTTQSRWQQNMQSSVFNPFLSSLAANTLLPVPATLVQKVSPVRPQTYCYMTGKQIDSTSRNCVSAADQRLNQVQSVHSGNRIVSVVKPSASSVSDTQIPSTSVEPTVTDNRSLHMLLPVRPIHTNQKVNPRCGTATPMSFDAGRTDRGLPLAQVYPSRVVTSTVQNTTVETVPSPVHCKKEPVRKSPLNGTQLLDNNCPTVCSTSTSSITKTTSHVKTDAALPALMSLGNCNTVKSPVSVPTTSADISPLMPILSPNVSNSSFLSHAPSFTVSPEPCAAKLTYDKGILPPVETSPLSLSDRESIPDEYDSGHELFSTYMEWDDSNMSDRKDCLSDVCHMEESFVKRPAFEVVGDCNRTLLSDIIQPCYATVAFDRSLLQNKSDDRDFILRTKYYRFFSRKTYAAGSDLDAVQSDKCSSPNITCGASPELRLPVPLSSALRGSASSKSKSKASGAVPSVATTFPDCGNLDDIESKYSLTTESNCKYGVLDRNVRGLHRQKPSATYDVIGSVYSATLNNRPKGGNRTVHSNSVVHVKSETVEVSAGAENKPDVLKKTVSRIRRWNIPTELPVSTSSSCNEFVGNTDESNNTVSEQERDSCSSAKDIDAKTTVGRDCMKYVADSLVGARSKSMFSVHSQLTKVSDGCNKVHCKQDLPTVLTVANGSVNSGRKNPQGKVPDVMQRKPGDANNNQGKTVDVLAASTSARSVNEPEHLKDVRQLVKTGTNSDDGSKQSECVQQSARVAVHTRASTSSSKSDTMSTYRLCRTTSSVSKQLQMRSDSKSKASSHSADGAASLLPSKSDETLSKQTFTTSETNRQKFRSVRQLNKSIQEQSVAKVDDTAKVSKSDNSLNASDVTGAHSKPQSSILKQLESSEGYIAENIKYSKSEDLFDDSNLLSREQRALRVSSED